MRVSHQSLRTEMENLKIANASLSSEMELLRAELQMLKQNTPVLKHNPDPNNSSLSTNIHQPISTNSESPNHSPPDIGLKQIQHDTEMDTTHNDNYTSHEYTNHNGTNQDGTDNHLNPDNTQHNSTISSDVNHKEHSANNGSI